MIIIIIILIIIIIIIKIIKIIEIQELIDPCIRNQELSYLFVNTLSYVIYLLSMYIRKPTGADCSDYATC